METKNLISYEILKRKSFNALCTVEEWSEFNLILEKLGGMGKRRIKFFIILDALRAELKKEMENKNGI